MSHSPARRVFGWYGVAWIKDLVRRELLNLSDDTFTTRGWHSAPLLVEHLRTLTTLVMMTICDDDAASRRYIRFGFRRPYLVPTVRSAKNKHTRRVFTAQSIEPVCERVRSAKCMVVVPAAPVQLGPTPPCRRAVSFGEPKGLSLLVGGTRCRSVPWVGSFSEGVKESWLMSCGVRYASGYCHLHVHHL